MTDHATLRRMCDAQADVPSALVLVLYAASCREARRRGYRRVITYTLASETGASVRAAGFELAASVRGQQWDRPSRRRSSRTTTPARVRWERAA